MTDVQDLAADDSAGALAVTKRGASPSLPTADEVDALLAQQRQPAGTSAGEDA